MSDFKDFDPKVFEEENEEEQNPQVTEIDTSGGTLLDKPLTNPILKALLVVTLVTFVVALPAIIGTTLITSLNNRRPKSAPKEASNLLEQDKQAEIEELKTELAQIEVKAESQNLEAETKQKQQEAKAKPRPTPTPTPPVKTEVPKQLEPVAKTAQIQAPPPAPKVAPQTQVPIYIPPVPKSQPIAEASTVSLPVKKITPQKTSRTNKNPNPARLWQQARKAGFASYTPNRPVTNTRRQPAQAAVQVAASYPVAKPRNKVVKSTKSRTFRLTKGQRISRYIKTRSLAKSDFKTQKRLQIKTVSATEASQPINAEVAKGYGLFLNFGQLGEEVTGVLVGDPTQITFHHNNGFVFIRQIKPINFPAITRSAGGGTQLVVLTNSEYGTKQYVFHLTPVDEKVSYSGIVLRPNKPQLIQPREDNNFTNTI